MSEVQRLQNELTSLQNSYKYYVSVRDTAKAQSEQAKDRRKKIKALNDDLKKDFDGNSRDVNRYGNKIDDDIKKGIKGNEVYASILTIIQDDQEKEPENDTDLKNAISQLDDEYTELNSYYEQKKGEASNAQSQINSLSWQITQKKSAIKKAKLAALLSPES